MSVQEPSKPSLADSDTKGVSGSLNSLFERYLKYHETILGSTDATIKHKRVQLGGFLHYLESQDHPMLPSELTALDVLGQLSELHELGRKPATINTRLRSIKAWCRWMLKWKIIDEDPTVLVDPAKVPKIRKPFISEAHFHALLDLCPPTDLLGARRSAILWLFLTSGIRKREMANLRLEDLHWDRDSLRVIGKGEKEREAPFVYQAQLAIMKYTRHRHDELPWLWVTEEREAKRMSYDGLGRDLSRLVERAGLKGQVKDVCHIFRRTLAANAVRQGVTRPHIMGAMGWNSEAMIAHYTAAMELETEALEEVSRIKPFGG